MFAKALIEAPVNEGSANIANRAFIYKSLCSKVNMSKTMLCSECHHEYFDCTTLGTNNI